MLYHENRIFDRLVIDAIHTGKAPLVNAITLLKNSDLLCITSSIKNRICVVKFTHKFIDLASFSENSILLIELNKCGFFSDQKNPK